MGYRDLTAPAYLGGTLAILDADYPMPEIPDIEAYIEALRERVLGEVLLGVRVMNPFLLRTVDPPLSTVAGRRVEAVLRLGKRIVFELPAPADGLADVAPQGTVHGPATTPAAAPAEAPADGRPPGLSEEPLFLVLHLMVAGRLHWKAAGAPAPKGAGLAALDFAGGTLLITEAGKKRRAALWLLAGRQALVEMDPGGIETLQCGLEEFDAALRRENHTLKRALTDPHIVSGIGNAYSDEILHRARLSPFKQTHALDAEEMSRLYAAARSVLTEWTDKLQAEARERFPEKVTAFRPEMAVHGRFGAPCPECGTKIQRIVYSENECDYCPGCQTQGRILADRSLSRLLRDDWAEYAGS